VIVTATLTYIATLHYVHENRIAPQFSYLQFTYREPDPSNYAIAIAIAVALAVLLPRRLTRPSHFIVWILFVVAIVPSLMVPQYTEALSVEAAATLSYWVGLSYLPVALFGSRRALKGFVPRMRVTPARFWLALGVGAALADAYLLAAVGLGGLEWPSLNDVYGLRGEFAETKSTTVGLAYVAPYMVNVINPLLMIRGLWGRRWFWLAFGAFGQALVYASSGNKSALLSPAALLVGFLLFRAARRPPAAAVLLGTVVGSWAMVLMDWISATNDWTSLMVRRFLILPGLSTAGYVAVFTDMEKGTWAYAFLSPFFDYPYGAAEPADIVGAEFFGRDSIHANANMLADGFANLGHPGMLIECLVLVVLLWVIDDAARGIPLPVAATLFFVLALSLADSGIFTSITTDGFLLAILLCACMPRTGWGRCPSATAGTSTSARALYP
jgi:hypothetical protein